MSYVRLIPSLSLKDERIVKTVKFDEYRDVGAPASMGKVFDSQDVDELIFSDISASQEGREPDWESIEKFADECSMPLTMGGGISSVKVIEKYLDIGADKVTVNSHAVDNKKFLTVAASTFGTQCIVVSIDAFKSPDGDYEVLIKGGFEKTGLLPWDWAKECEELGAGEILLSSINQDGTMEGFDLNLINKVCEAVKIPVIANSGAGLLYDLIEVCEHTSASAIACSSIFAFTDNKPVKAKAFLDDNGVKTRPL